MLKTDFLIIGSGIAGLTYAIKTAEFHTDKHITIVTKSDEGESNTKYAQGGVAVVLDSRSDSFDKHVGDTLKCGDGLCDREVVEFVVRQGPQRLQELIQWGANFDINEKGFYKLGKEGGHTASRVIHHKDITGFEIERALLKRVHQLPNITFLTDHFAIDLIVGTKSKRCCAGAYILDIKTNKVKALRSSSVLLASGGIGQVYGHTTNPIIATGDGIAMAYRAGAVITDMEFVQFHPTVLYQKESGSSFLISEAVRGFGAYLRNIEGKRFVFDYDDRGEMASRDIVSRAVFNELMTQEEDFVFLDCTHLDMRLFKAHFPTIYDKCLKEGINVAADPVPVSPAAHYICGGIQVDKNGKTSVSNLFACGESSRTGLHGANRLASNSLLEALVYAHRIFEYQKSVFPAERMIIGEYEVQKVQWTDKLNKVETLKTELQKIMRHYTGIVRCDSGLRKAGDKVNVLKREIEMLFIKEQRSIALYELRNMVDTAELIINQSALRKENRGGFYNIDNIAKELHLV
ncbi:L-aspartate oxidase [Zhouia spongiae]|uniref:L-aspartate oxidase n=1 Tax=Zhouia spongiae TaxID=2202721 RepID=A0ABY3YJI6_9FLAO|nr:L-aspartate oxidase [Zhouia spongiae]UNY98011.1 L-aspartate oxidase [Zhouia spongiae]